MKTGINTYVLLTGSINPVWQLRQNNVLVDFEEVDDKGKKTGNVSRRKIRYVKGERTIWDDEIPEKRKTSSIDLVDGKIEIDQKDSILNLYMQTHPEYKVNFKLLDLDAEAEEEYRLMQIVDEARDKLSKLDLSKAKAVAVTLFGARSARGWGEARVKLALRDYIEDTDSKPTVSQLNPEYFLDVIENPSTDAKFMVLDAIDAAVIEVAPDSKSVRWTENNGVIIPVAQGKDPISEMAEFILSKEGKTTFTDLKKKLG